MQVAVVRACFSCSLKPSKGDIAVGYPPVLITQSFFIVLRVFDLGRAKGALHGSSRRGLVLIILPREARALLNHLIIQEGFL